MAYQPSTRKHETKRITLTYDGEELWVEYRPHAITGAALDESFGETQAYRSNARLIPHQVAAWDVLDADGNQYEPTFENALLLEPAFVSAVFAAIQADMRPNGQSGSGSFSG